MKQRRIKQSPKLPAGVRRQQFLEAAFTLFMKKGYRSTTTEDIARSVGLTKGALYFHFKNKEELLLEVVRGLSQRVLGSIRKLPDKKATPAKILEAMTSAKKGFPCCDFANFLDFWGQAVRLSKVKRIMDDVFEQFDKLVAKKISHDYGGSSKERREIAMLVGALYDGLWSRALVCGKDINVKRLTRLIDNVIPVRSAK